VGDWNGCGRPCYPHSYTHADIAYFSPDTWWFVVTTLSGAVIADIIATLYEKAYSGRKEPWAFTIRFAPFAESIVGAGILGELAKSAFSFGLFESSFSIAYVLFWSLNSLLPALVFVDFRVRSDYYVVRTKKESRPRL
jgi:hypothetical protein